MRLPYNDCENDDMTKYDDEKIRCSSTRTSRLSLPNPCVLGMSQKAEGGGRGRGGGWTCFKFIIASICTVLLPMGIVLYISIENESEKKIRNEMIKDIKIENGDIRKLGKMIESKISKKIGHLIRIKSGSIDMKMKVRCGEEKIGTCEEIVNIKEIRNMKIGKDRLGRCFVKNDMSEKTWIIGDCIEVELKLKKGMSVIDENIGEMIIGEGSGRQLLEKWINLKMM